MKVNRFLKNILQVNYTSHDFRHSKVTDLLNEGVKLKEVATYVGHSNPSTTLRYYNVDEAQVMQKVKNLNKTQKIPDKNEEEVKI
jgi:integrase